MKTLKALMTVAVAVELIGILTARADEAETKQEFIEAKQQTELLGGVAHPSREDLLTMRKGSYILRARGGKLTKVPAEKNKLPHDPKARVQDVSVVRAANGSIYVKQRTIMCKSTDGGRTWSSYKLPGEEESSQLSLTVYGWPGGEYHLWQILSDGTFISVGGGAWGKRSDPLPVRVSKDQGRSWQEISDIKLPPQYNERYPYHMYRLPDGTLLCGIGCRDHTSGVATLNVYHSSNGGKTWQGPSKVIGWSSEGGIVQVASGKLLAVCRYQRPLLPTDPPDLLERTGGRKYPYKHVFLADSTDGGKSWTDWRQLTTVFGQCRGYPAALSDGTVVVIHDNRTTLGPPGSPGSRAMVSHDEGKTWEDEVYYLDYSAWGGSYNASVVLEDDLILTIDGTTDRGSGWSAAIGHADMTAIRWRLADTND